MTTHRIIKYTLMIGIFASLALISLKIPNIIAAGAFSDELPFVILSGAIIISPYLYLLTKLKHINDNQYCDVNLLATSTIITLPAIILLFMLIYVYPDAQNGIAIFNIVFAQWFLCFISSMVKAITKKENIKNHRTNQLTRPR